MNHDETAQSQVAQQQAPQSATTQEPLQPSQTPKRLRTYTGEELDVTYDAGRCIHAAECLRRICP